VSRQLVSKQLLKFVFEKGFKWVLSAPFLAAC
jgi:hypothetical protein